jgi:glucokinase
MAADCVIGVDLGGTKLLAGVVDPELNVHHRAQRRARGDDEAGVLGTIVDAVREAREAHDGAIAAVGVGIPSLIDPERGLANSTVHLPLQDVPVRDLLAERLGLPVWLDNDANAALLAEHRAGTARGASDAVMLTIGTGIGGAVLVAGRLVRGAGGGAGEWGHTVIEAGGPPCDCGSAGCLEALASGTALGREAERLARSSPGSGLGEALAAGRDITGMLATELAHDGDECARRAVALVGERLGVGVANVVNALNPQVVVIGGGVIAAGELLLGPVRDVVARQALAPSARDVRVEPAWFGEESGMLGAALLALDGLTGRGTAGAA